MSLYFRSMYSMRRPLCAAALLITAAVSLILFFLPHKAASFERLDNAKVVLLGEVFDKQYKLSSQTGKLSLLVTLGDYSFEAVGGSSKDPPEVHNSRKVLVRIPVNGDAVPCSEDSLMAIGSKVRINGVLRCFVGPSNNGEFDSALYYEVQGYDFEVRSAALLAYSADKDVVGNTLYLLRRRISSCIDSCFTDLDDAAIVKAMLLGEKGYITDDLKSLYQDTGIIHILAISGLHISLIGMGLFGFLRKHNVRVTISAALSSLVIILYAIMTGLSVSAFRAFFTFFIHMGAYLLHRTYDLMSAVALCGVILIISQPLFLLYSGFLFSFCTVIAIGAVMPVLPERLGRNGILKYIRPKSLAIPSGALPVYLCFYGSFPVYSLILNMFVLPMMSVLMLFGMAAAAAGLIAVKAGAALALVPHVILTAYKTLCILTTRMPFHMEVIGHPCKWTVIIYIVMLLWLIVFEEYIPDLVKTVIVMAAMMLLTFRFSNGLQIHAADVGQGDGILIMADGMNITIDGGSTSKTGVAGYTLEPMLAYYGVGSIDYAIITHEDEDHINGIVEIIENGSDKGIYVRHIILPELSDSNGIESIAALAKKKGIPILYMKRGDVLKHGKLSLICLNPADGESYESSNAASDVLLLEYGLFSALFTGDIEGAAEKECLSYMKNEGLLRGELTVLKVAHHGSSGSTDSDFLSYVMPKYSVISCGVNNRYGHPHEETIARLREIGTKILDTRYTGEITFRTDGRKLKIETHKREHMGYNEM